MSAASVLERIRTTGIIPVIRVGSHDGVSDLMHAISAGGISVFEITLTIPNAVSLIEALADEFGDAAVIGAGTVMTPQQANDCVAAGARFIVSPVTDRKIIDVAKQADVCVFPGALTPTEIESAWSAGADAVKVFPINAVGGSAYLRSIKAPFPHIELIPSGGVTAESIGDMISAGSLAAAIGSFSDHLSSVFSTRDQSGMSDARARITLLATQLVDAVSTARNTPG